MTMSPPLSGKVVVVTGASQGLGAAFATAVREAGAQVVLAARRPELVHRLADELGAGEGDVLGVACDITVADDRELLVTEAVGAFGRIDVLVNNAGIAVSGSAIDEPAEAVERVIGTNLVAPYQLCQLVARGMLSRRSGSIVNVSSVAALVSFDRYALGAYVASKAGLHGLTRELAAQWGSHNLRVNALAPGWFPGGTNRYLQDDELRSWIESRTALRRPGRAAELAAALVFLASDASSYVRVRCSPSTKACEGLLASIWESSRWPD